MANETVTSNLAAVFATDMVSREIAESLQANVVIAPHVWIERAVGTNVVKFGSKATLAATSYTEATGMSLTAYNPTQITVTCAPVGITVRVGGQAEAIRPETIAEVAQEQGKGIGAKIDTDLGALFPSFTASVGATTTAMSVAYWLSAIAKLNAANVAQDGRVGILSATAYSDLLSNSQSINSFAFQEAAKTGRLPNFYGVDVAMSTVLTTANTGADYVSAMFHRNAVGLGLLRDIGVRVQPAPAQYDSTDIAGTVSYGVALVGNARGVKIISKV